VTLQSMTSGSTPEYAVPRRAANRLRAVGLGLAALALSLTVGGDYAAADEQTTETVALGSATRAADELDMDFGDLSVRAGAAGSGNLMEAEFAFDDDDWRPSVEYGIADDEGQLKVGQPGDASDVGFGDLDNLVENDGNAWDVALSTEVPVDLTVDLDTGYANVDLDGFNLTGLDLEMEAGEVKVDFSGVAPTQDVEATIEVEAGDVEVVVPAGIGVRIDAEAGAGDIDADGFERDGDAYLNVAYGESPVTIRIEVDAAIGQIDLKVANAA
jgi:hypothetical protein